MDIVGMKEGTTKSTVTGVEMFKKQLNQGQAGDNVGLLLRGIKREDVERGQVRAVGSRECWREGGCNQQLRGREEGKADPGTAPWSTSSWACCKVFRAASLDLLLLALVCWLLLWQARLACS